MASIEDWGMALGALILLPFALGGLAILFVLYLCLKVVKWFMGE